MTLVRTISDNQVVDITLLVEGTFPYVMGGVSSWIYQILCSFPQYNFAIIFLGSRPEDYHGVRYELPENLVHLETHFLFSSEFPDEQNKKSDSEQVFKDIVDLHEKFKQIKAEPFGSTLAELHRQLFSKDALSSDEFLHGSAAWDFITQEYSNNSPDISFIDYFWSVRNMHFPIWQLIKIAQQAPKTKMLHSASTGYAGLLGAFIHNLRGCPYVLTEHGIYTKERRIDLLQSEWLAFNGAEVWRKIKTSRHLAGLWIKFFETCARISYLSADPIISLFDSYKERQIQDGAPKERTQVIANGIIVDKFKQHGTKILNTERPIVCFLGRVIQIKDIKTFIRTTAIIVQQIPSVSAWIVGSMDDDPDYAMECKNLVATLGLTDHITFLGKQVAEEILAKVDLLILSSISEGLPFVILEAFAANVPVVATDVAACTELIYGKTEEDKALGKSGEVVGIANPKELAKAAIHLLQNPKEWIAASQAGFQRVNKYYNLPTIMEDYLQIYKKALNEWLE